MGGGAALAKATLEPAPRPLFLATAEGVSGLGPRQGGDGDPREGEFGRVRQHASASSSRRKVRNPAWRQTCIIIYPRPRYETIPGRSYEPANYKRTPSSVLSPRDGSFRMDLVKGPTQRRAEPSTSEQCHCPRRWSGAAIRAGKSQRAIGHSCVHST